MSLSGNEHSHYAIFIERFSHDLVCRIGPTYSVGWAALCMAVAQKEAPALFRVASFNAIFLGAIPEWHSWEICILSGEATLRVE